MIIAVDFDGTVVTNKYPSIGQLLPHAKRVLHRLKQSGHDLILWTCRCDNAFKEAVAWCKEQGLPFDLYNDVTEGTIELYGLPEPAKELRFYKVFADVYIDDKSLEWYGKATVDWLDIECQLELKGFLAAAKDCRKDICNA